MKDTDKYAESIPETTIQYAQHLAEPYREDSSGFVPWATGHGAVQRDSA
jgi:hypothetical protein